MKLSEVTQPGWYWVKARRWKYADIMRIDPGGLGFVSRIFAETITMSDALKKWRDPEVSGPLQSPWELR